MDYKQINNDVRKIIEVCSGHLRENISKDEIGSMFKTIKELRIENVENAVSKFNFGISISYLGAIYLGILTLTLKNTISPINSSWKERIEIKEVELVLESMLCQITNYSLSVIKLVEEGFDLQARVLLRSLMEVVETTLVIIADEKYMNDYCRGKDSDSAAIIWSENFRRKRINEVLGHIEQTLMEEKDQEILSFLARQRKGAYKFYSSILHGSFYSNILGSHSTGNGDVYISSNVFGNCTDDSFATLRHLNWSIFYFIVISESIFKNVHKFKVPRETDDMWSICEVAKQSFIGAALYTDYFD